MPVTLRWLLERRDLGLRLLGDHDPDRVSIGWAHAIELTDPTPWLQGEELVLTTGLRLPRARGEQLAYAARLAGAGIAAVAFGTGVRFESVPPALRAACAEHGLPLVEVPLPTPFVAVTQAIAGRLAELQYESLERTVRFQRRLTAAAQEVGSRGVVEALADELDCGVLLLGADRQPVLSARADDDWTARVGAELGRRPGSGRTGVRVVEGDRALEIQSLGDGAREHGWLAIARTAPGTERVLLNQAVALLTLLLARTDASERERRRLGAAVLELLLESPDCIGRDRLPYFGIDPAGPLTVLMCRAGATPPDAGLDALRLPYLASVRDDGTAVLLVNHRDAGRCAEQVATDAGPTVGVSGPVGPDSIASGVTQAGRAADAARWRHERIVRYESLTLARALDDPEVRERLGGLAEHALAPLHDHPALLESLEVFLRTNGSWETASRTLGVHRHTLRNRMERIEELTGTNLRDAESRALLLVALIAR